MTKDRDAFEKIMLDNGLDCFKHENGTYRSGETAWAHKVWQAARQHQEPREVAIDLWQKLATLSAVEYYACAKEWDHDMPVCRYYDYEQMEALAREALRRLDSLQPTPTEVKQTGGDVDTSHADLVSMIQNEIMGMLHASSTYTDSKIPESEYRITANVYARVIAAKILTSAALAHVEEKSAPESRMTEARGPWRSKLDDEAFGKAWEAWLYNADVAKMDRDSALKGAIAVYLKSSNPQSAQPNLEEMMADAMDEESLKALGDGIWHAISYAMLQRLAKASLTGLSNAGYLKGAK